MEKYNPGKIEKKWQVFWEKQGLYRAKDFSKKPKKYILVEFPYPSGEGLHVGHCRSYSALDVVARKKRMEGFNVLFPIGWDAFGLPTENYAIRTGIHPQIATKKNIANFKKQAKRIGFSFDWPREINTTDPEYYRWTQWIFLQLFKQGLAYQAKIPINWCPSCKIGLANEEVVEGKCERCGREVKKKVLEQWMLKITKYADRLINDLKKVDYPERVKNQQINWIGRSVGAEIKFQVSGFRFQVEVFTTRADTLFGCTYLVVAPEHEIIKNLEFRIKNLTRVKEYIKGAKRKSDLQRESLEKEKTGIRLEGIKAINPANGEEIPIFVADYVFLTYGTGAIMAVPAHDNRDWAFAKKYNLPIRQVIAGEHKSAIIKAYEGEGNLINSGKFNGMKSEKARQEITKWLQKRDYVKKTTQYKLRDWVFSRQHYWGEPIPLVFCENCKKSILGSPTSNGGLTSVKLKFSKGELLNPGWIAVSEKDLPVKLPYVKKYKPTKTGKSPLVNVSNWVNTKCPKCGGKAKRETDTMPNWAGSSWYFLRYTDPQNNKSLAEPKKIKYWLPVDWYNGGMEHTNLHLLYSRFWYKFLYDIGVVFHNEPYGKRTSHGMVLAEDGRKMSKSLGNVINPDDIVKNYGADSLRLYELFMGPFEQTVCWDSKSIKGAYRFLDRVWKLKSQIQNTNSKLERLIHQTIKKVTEDIEGLKFNTAVAALMSLLNEMEKEKGISLSYYLIFIKLLSPFAPHISEEIYSSFAKTSKDKQHKKSIFLQPWPRYNPKLIKAEKFELVIQVNGKVRDKIEVPQGISEKETRKLTLEREKIKKWLKEKKIKKIIFIKNKLINIVV